ncbi:MAG: hypothetical protein R2710_31045 [Acidimicrobiales bacterium]
MAVLELIRTMTGEGRTVLMCTHLLLEAEARRSGRGDAARHEPAVGRPDQLARQFWPKQVVRIGATDGADLDVLARMNGVSNYERSASVASLEVDHLDRVPQLVADLVRRGVAITNVSPFTPTLEDLYCGAPPERLDRRRDSTTRRLDGATRPPVRCFGDGTMTTIDPTTAPLGTSDRERFDRSRMLTVARTDLKQLIQARDFWFPMILLGSFFFVLIPAFLLLSITQIGSVETVAKVSESLDMFPPAAQARSSAIRRRAAPATRLRCTCSHRSR